MKKVATAKKKSRVSGASLVTQLIWLDNIPEPMDVMIDMGTDISRPCVLKKRRRVARLILGLVRALQFLISHWGVVERR